MNQNLCHCTVKSPIVDPILSQMIPFNNLIQYFFKVIYFMFRSPGKGVQAVPRICIKYAGICLTTEENHGKPQSG